MELPATATAPTANQDIVTTTRNTTTPATQTSTVTMDMILIKTELAQLKDVIAAAVAQIKEAITTLRDAKSTTSPATKIADDPMDSDTDNEHLTPQDLQSFICDLKHELATLFIETRAMIQQQPLPQPTKHSQPKT